MPLMQQVGVDVVFSPRLLTAGAILKYIRRGDIISVTVLGEERAEMIELIAQPGSIAVNKELYKVKFLRGAVLAIFGDTVIIPMVRVSLGRGSLIVFIFNSIHKVENCLSMEANINCLAGSCSQLRRKDYCYYWSRHVTEM